MARKISICFFNTTRFWGGGEKWHFEMANHMASRGHRVSVVARPGGELHRRLRDHQRMKVIPLVVSNFSFLNIFKMKRLTEVFRAEQVETVVFNGSSDVKLGAPSARMAGVPAIVYRRGLAVAVKDSLFNRFIYGRLTTHLLTNSIATRDKFLECLKVPAGSLEIQTIYNGIDLSLFADQRPVIRNGPETSPIVIGTAGRLESEKGHDLLLAAARKLFQTGLNFHLRVAGEGSQRRQIQDTIDDAGLAGSIELIGFVDDMASFFQSIDIFALPSRWEGFGFVTAEAMAAGRPVVAFDVGSNRELVLNGVTGFLIPLGDIDAFADKIMQLSQDPQLMAKMGKCGRERAFDMFDQQKQFEKLERFFSRTVFDPGS